MDKGRPAALRVRARSAAAAREPPRPPAAHTPWAKWESQASEASPPRLPAASRLAWLFCSSLQTAMDRVGADSIAVLDRALTGPDRAGAYDCPRHDRAVLRQPSRQAWREAAQRASPSRLTKNSS